MNHIKCLLAAVLLVGNIASAHAEDFYWDFTLSEGKVEFPGEAAPGSFMNNMHFRVEQVRDIDFGVGSLSLTLRGIPHYDIQGLSMSLFDSAGNPLGNGVDFSVSHILPNNDYYLQIAGNATGTAGGMYFVVMNPVPEPGMGSSLMAGLLMLAFMAARRRDIQ